MEGLGRKSLDGGSVTCSQSAVNVSGPAQVVTRDHDAFDHRLIKGHFLEPLNRFLDVGR